MDKSVKDYRWFLPLKPSLKLAGIINSWTLPRYSWQGHRWATTRPPYPPSSSRTEPRNPCKRCGPSGCSKGSCLFDSTLNHPATRQAHRIQRYGTRCDIKETRNKFWSRNSWPYATVLGLAFNQPASRAKWIGMMVESDCKKETDQKWRLKHSGSMYLCTNFSMSGAVRGFNSLGFSTSWVEYNEWIWCRHKRQKVLPSNPK